jgi:hypothetical protein
LRAGAGELRASSAPGGWLWWARSPSARALG